MKDYVESCGADAGEKFSSEQEVRDYFTTESMAQMMSGATAVMVDGENIAYGPTSGGGAAIGWTQEDLNAVEERGGYYWKQSDLDEAAEWVIDNRFHCAF